MFFCGEGGGGGDFNCIDSLELDIAGGNSQAGDKGSVELKDFADSLSLCDVSRVKFLKRNTIHIYVYQT